MDWMIAISNIIYDNYYSIQHEGEIIIWIKYKLCLFQRNNVLDQLTLKHSKWFSRLEGYLGQKDDLCWPKETITRLRLEGNGIDLIIWREHLLLYFLPESVKKISFRHARFLAVVYGNGTFSLAHQRPPNFQHTFAWFQA